VQLLHVFERCQGLNVMVNIYAYSGRLCILLRLSHLGRSLSDPARGKRERLYLAVHVGVMMRTDSIQSLLQCTPFKTLKCVTQARPSDSIKPESSEYHVVNESLPLSVTNSTNHVNITIFEISNTGETGT